MKYGIQSSAFMTDGMADYPHFSPIRKLVFISRHASGIAQIGVLDEMGLVSLWSVVEISTNLVSEYDLNVTLGGKFKMDLNYTENLMDHPHVIDILTMEDLTQSIEIEFDPEDSQVFYFSTSAGLFKIDKHESNAVPTPMDTLGLGSPTALSMNDRGFLLVAFSCGSIW